MKLTKREFVYQFVLSRVGFTDEKTLEHTIEKAEQLFDMLEKHYNGKQSTQATQQRDNDSSRTKGTHKADIKKTVNEVEANPKRKEASKVRQGRKPKDGKAGKLGKV